MAMAAEAQRRIALQRGTRQPQHGARHHRTASLHHRGHRGRSAEGQSTLQHMEKPRVPNVKGRAAAGCALGGGEAGAGLECTRAARARSRRVIRGGPVGSRCAEVPASARPATDRTIAMLAVVCIAMRRATRHNSHKSPARRRKVDSGRPRATARQRAEHAATVRAHHGIDHRHLARGGHPWK